MNSKTQPHGAEDSTSEPCASLETVEQASSPRIPRILLIDDDPEFATLFWAFASEYGVQLEFYDSLLELGSVGLLGDYDVVILDYQLAGMTGVEIAEYLDVFFNGVPVFLISATDLNLKSLTLPTSVRRFLRKSLGPEYIIREVIAQLPKLEAPSGKRQ